MTFDVAFNHDGFGMLAELAESEMTEDDVSRVLIDPLRATTSYSNNLYSYEFFELIKSHLSDKGVFMLWFSEFQVIPQTVLSVFEHVEFFGFYCLASRRPLTRYPEQQEGLLASFSDPRIRQSIANHFDQMQSVKRMVGRISRDVRIPINRDWKPVCEYYLGLQIRQNLVSQNK